MSQILQKIKDLDWLRAQIIGRNEIFTTPFGKKPLVYADYTASGRSLKCIENHLLHLQKFYANTHTEDDVTGKIMTKLLYSAEQKIKEYVNAGDNGHVIFADSGCTGAVTRLQMILGVFLPRATVERICALADSNKKSDLDLVKKIKGELGSNRPVVFVGPYEHHSNELTWKYGLCDKVQIPLTATHEIDLEILKYELKKEEYKDRLKIGAFSAASNISGLNSNVYEIAKILHQNDALAFFDFAASGPYVPINMNYNKESYFDGIYFSPHKFLGGPGSSGILIFNENIYRRDLPPTVCAGGTVDYVSKWDEMFSHDIGSREKPGTPGALQAYRIALALDLKAKIGYDNITDIEEFFIEKFYSSLKNYKNFKMLGPTDATKKVGIISFDILDGDKVIHHKFVTKLMNDLFGIQTRAGCACAGPYGHHFLDIPDEKARLVVQGVKDGVMGVKPGWVRLNMHYVFTIEEVEYIIEAIKFIADNAKYFLQVYEFHLNSGSWHHEKSNDCDGRTFLLSIDNSLTKPVFDLSPNKDINDAEIFSNSLKEAKDHLEKIKNKPLKPYLIFEKEIQNVMNFDVVNEYKLKPGEEPPLEIPVC